MARCLAAQVEEPMTARRVGLADFFGVSPASKDLTVADDFGAVPLLRVTGGAPHWSNAVLRAAVGVVSVAVAPALLDKALL
jgi:hypothetical protein